MQVSQTKQFRRLLEFIKLYKQNPLEKFFIVTIYQNYTLALILQITHNSLINVNRKGKSIMTYESAAFVVRYLASRRPFSQSFDIYLTQVSVSNKSCYTINVFLYCTNRTLNVLD